MNNASYDFAEMEKKWSSVWDKTDLYKCNIEHAKKPFYNLWMFPYPSGARMHVGHAYASTGSDIIGRYKRMQGFEVFQPMGFDAFGIHGENYALKVGRHPQELMEELCDRFRDEQFKAIGHGYDWSCEVRTYQPEYYKWTQWIFLQLYKAGLAERKEAKVNWCSSCKTVLADEQVVGGECERCHSIVQQKVLMQWFFKITQYADRLLGNLDKINWSKKVIEAQRNWIGKSEGSRVKFKLQRPEMGYYPVGVVPPRIEIEVFTTRPDTLFGATYLVLAPEHPLVESITTEDQRGQVKEYVKQATAKTEIERTNLTKEKTGVFTGAYAVNPINEEQIPVWIADYVLAGYGTGAIMAVPAHDERDFEFAKKYKLPVIEVVSKKEGLSLITPYEGEGTLINSGEFTGLNSQEGAKAIVKKLARENCGEFAVNYKLRDWLISRQRYWSAPIPIIYCDKCGTVPVPENDLPVELPYVEDWKPKGDGRGPLANVSEFVNTTCPICHSKATRETDTSDNFLDSGWYFYRYPYSKREDVAFDSKSESFKKWFPVHLYIGGAEHSVLHLMYTRFLTMALHDMGYMTFDEPFKKFFAHGLITKSGSKMSKSVGNIVNPDEYIAKIGADAFRIYLMFLGPYSQGGDFNDSGISGVTRFLQRFWQLVNRDAKSKASKIDAKKKLAKTIASISQDIEDLKFNTCISALMDLVNVWEKGSLSSADVSSAVKMLAPFAPFMAEDLWQTYFADKKNSFVSVHKEVWPVADPKLLQEESIVIPITVNGKLRGQITVDALKVGNQEFVLNIVKNSPAIKKMLEDKTIRKEIYIEGKIVNFVV